MHTRIAFHDGTEAVYDVTGHPGEPAIPFTYEFEVGYAKDRKRISIPLFAIKEIETVDPPGS